MSMKDRERGSKGGIGRYNTIFGRWFEGKKEQVLAKVSISKHTKDHAQIIERGTVVTLRDDNSFFLVFAVMKVTGNKKWWNSPKKDELAWPISQSVIKSKSYRLKVRKLRTLNDTVNEATLYYLPYQNSEKGGVQDGVNVRSTYRMLRCLKNVTGVHTKIDI